MAASRAVLASLCLLLGIVAGAQAYESVAEFATDQPTLSTVLQLVVDAGLADALGPDFAGTAILPTNDAFSKISDVVATLTPDQVKNVLLFHVSGTYVRSVFFDAKPPRRVATLLTGQTVQLTSKTPDDWLLNKVKVVGMWKVGKAKVFIVDDVLIPKL